MDASATLDAEVAPHIWRVPEVELLNGAASWLEAVVGIF